MKVLFALLLATLMLNTVSSRALAAGPLVIHAAEIGVGKFHRYDNKVHPYAADNAWLPYVMPDGAASDQTFSRKNADGSYTIFFTNLDDLLTNVVTISNTEHTKVSVLNVHGHGLPGAMWFPPNAESLNDWACSQWKDAADGDDKGNYDQYYSPVTTDEIQQVKDMSDNANVQMPCVSGVNEWRAAMTKNPAFKATIDTNAQLHFLSCVVGMGTMGEQFTKGMADLILSTSGHARAETSMDFGLGDWSMPRGMGFWNYQSDDQVSHDASVYPVDRKDSEIAQKGSIRIASYSGAWTTSIASSLDVMALGFETAPPQGAVLSPVLTSREHRPLPARIRVPGTAAYVELHQ